MYSGRSRDPGGFLVGLAGTMISRPFSSRAEIRSAPMLAVEGGAGVKGATAGIKGAGGNALGAALGAVLAAYPGIQ